MWDLPRWDVDAPNLPAIQRTQLGGPRVNSAGFLEGPDPVEDVTTRSWPAFDAGQVVASSAAPISSHRQRQGSQ